MVHDSHGGVQCVGWKVARVAAVGTRHGVEFKKTEPFQARNPFFKGSTAAETAAEERIDGGRAESNKMMH